MAYGKIIVGTPNELLANVEDFNAKWIFFDDISWAKIQNMIQHELRDTKTAFISSVCHKGGVVLMKSLGYRGFGNHDYQSQPPKIAHISIADVPFVDRTVVIFDLLQKLQSVFLFGQIVIFYEVYHWCSLAIHFRIVNVIYVSEPRTSRRIAHGFGFGHGSCRSSLGTTHLRNMTASTSCIPHWKM